jgi:uncharacterized membrane protein
MRKTLLGLSIFCLLLSSFVAYAQTPEERVAQIFLNITNWLFTFLVGGAIIGVVIGAAMFLFAAGDPGKTHSAKMMVAYSLISVFIGAFAWTFVYWVRCYIVGGC